MIRYRKPTFDDVEPILALVNDYAAQGVMLARSRNMIYETLRDMIVAEEDGTLLGVGALHTIWDRLAEIRALAVAPAATGRGIGAELVRLLIDSGLELGVTKFITLTYKPGFFQKCGFKTITKDQLPQKVWKECIDCPKFPNCDEIAMVRYA